MTTIAVTVRETRGEMQFRLLREPTPPGAQRPSAAEREAADEIFRSLESAFVEPDRTVVRDRAADISFSYARRGDNRTTAGRPAMTRHQDRQTERKKGNP